LRVVLSLRQGLPHQTFLHRRGSEASITFPQGVIPVMRIPACPL
jgi:hypothetical protein